MMMKNQDLIKNLLIVGSGGAFVISTFLATVIFDRVSVNSTLTPQEIEMVRRGKLRFILYLSVFVSGNGCASCGSTH
jgi:hypothetical protein